jgi:hypothetical protein
MLVMVIHPDLFIFITAIVHWCNNLGWWVLKYVLFKIFLEMTNSSQGKLGYLAIHVSYVFTQGILGLSCSMSTPTYHIFRLWICATLTKRGSLLLFKCQFLCYKWHWESFQNIMTLLFSSSFVLICSHGKTFALPF